MGQLALKQTDALYGADTHAWALEQAAFLRAGRFDALDLANLAEEIEGLSKRERRELANRLAGLILHLLKWHFQPERRGRSWRASIAFQRDGIDAVLADSPSLHSLLANLDFQAEAFRAGRLQAIAETDLDIPEKPPFTIDQALDRTFLPD